ncbi:hypothetical protein FSP39_019729 [Pinctada imbricata]|uniref:BAR domain-containing protein n=1 Tax=Pinctada imbricata TaxID=66713 RepID=A0AA88Y5I5_PINIB|nr:hypothetical protein FSP39_019729 [Pinctada imbricata]
MKELEYMKCQARLEKHQDKERTGQNVVKLDTSRKALNKSKEDFENQNQALVEDLPKFVDNRIEYFQPCMDSLIKSEVTYNSEVYRVYTELADRMNKNNDKTTDQARGRIQQSLAEIKALSITVDD